MNIEMLSPAENDAEQRTENRIFSLLEKRERVALAALQIEEKLFRKLSQVNWGDDEELWKRDKEFRDQAWGIFTATFSERVSHDGRDHWHDILERSLEIFSRERKQVYIEKRLFQQELAKKGKAFTPVNLGMFLFESRAGQLPEGMVRVNVHEGHFVVICDREKDYLRFRFGQAGQMPKGWIGRESLSGGCFLKSFSVAGHVVRMVIINGEDTGYDIEDETLQASILHEQQHFINGVIFHGFQGIEPSYSVSRLQLPSLAESLEDPVRGLGVRKGLARIKNEMFARLREGYEDQGLHSFFKDPLYSYLREPFFLGERGDVEKLLEEIGPPLCSIIRNFPYTKDPAVLIYQLLDIPLTRFPEWLHHLERFYKSK